MSLPSGLLRNSTPKLMACFWIISLLVIPQLGKKAHSARLVEEPAPPAVTQRPTPTSKAKPPKATKALAPHDLITMNFDNVDIRTVIKFISEITGKNFLVDDRVKGTVTVISPTPISVMEAYQVFLSMLEMKGYTVTEAGKVTKVIPSREARTKDIQTFTEEELYRLRREDRIVTQLVPLSFADANEVRSMIRPLVSKDSNISVYLPTNTLIITDYASNIRRLLSIIKEMDVEGSDQKITVIPLNYASALTMVNELLALVETTARPPVRPRPRRGAPVGTAAIRATKILADERTNSVIIVANKVDTEKILGLIRKLDRPLPPGLSRIHVYYLENAKAEELVQVLTQLPTKVAAAKTTRKGPVGARAPVLGEEVQILADKPTNSLIIVASPQDFETLKGVIKKLDIMRAQVLVEALIVEVSLDKSKEIGVQWQYLSHEQAGNLRFYGATGPPGPVDTSKGAPDFSALRIGEFLMGVFKGPITIAGQEFLNLNALIRAFQTASDVNILSTPHILTLDNEEAEIVIAETRPFLKSQTGTAESTTTTEEAVTTGVVQTFEFKDVGITLRITPQISKGKFVRLNIYQEVSDVIGEVDTAGAFITSKRQARTTVVVKDGQTVVIGGLIQDRKARTTTGVPCLANIPIFGTAFRTKSLAGTKRNLLIFITPHILTSPEAMAKVTERKKKESEEHKKAYERWKARDIQETLEMILE